MLLQRIRLKGFLGHRGLNSANGGDGFVDIDLRSSPLWLIHGPNGGGKSSLWDAVTFALFKKHRASNKKNDRLARLIHDAADEAIVELEFELRGQQYLIQSKISKIKRRAKKVGVESKSTKSKDNGVKTWNIVKHWEEGGWESVPGTEYKAEEWVERNLGMSYETFVRAVLLRQGEADAFMRDLPSQRKSRLLELLQLEFYEELGKKANAERTKWGGKCDALEEALIRLLQPAGEKADPHRDLKGEIARLFRLIDERIETQRRLINEAQANSEHAVAALDKKEREFSDAQQAQSLLEQIKSVQERQGADMAIIERATAIEANAHQYRELKEVSRILDDLWEARRQLAEESQALAANANKVADMEERHRALTESLEQRRLNEEEAEEAFREASARLEQALEQQRVVKEQVTTLEQVEILEKEIQEAEEELKPYQTILKRRDRIEQEYERYTELSQALRTLKELGDATQQLEDARQQFESRRTELARQEEQAQHDREEEERLGLFAQNLSLECDRVRQEVSSRATELSRLRDKMEARNSVSGEEECPTCGSVLDDAARARIEHEREHWAEEAAQLGSESELLNRLLEEKTQALERARSELLTATDVALTSRLKVERSRSDLDHSAADVTRAEDVVEDARSRAGDWAEELTQFSALTEEFDGLAGSPEDWNRLLEAQQIENSVQSVVKAHRKQLKRLPQWSAEERGQLKAAAEKLAQTVANCTDAKATVEATLEAARANRIRIEKEQLRLDVELRTERERANELTRRKGDAQAKYENKQSELPPKWANDPACVDEAALSELKRKLEGLQGAEDEERELREARLRQEGHKGSLEILQAQLEEIPPSHRRDVTEVQRERDAADVAARRAGEELRIAKEEMVKLEEQKRVADKRREEFVEAEREFGYFRLLAEAFGPSGLRARVVQSAQEMIKSHANTILGRLSNGEWQVELQDVSETELEIQARNVMQLGAQPRPFEYLSGGEKFRVAVSLAVAIGQSVLGERVVDTLVIDEGFGSLDEINRDLMAKEMSHLSEEVLRGGRVVIVSHLDDVRSDFGSRYRISKDSEGYIQVEQNGQG